MYQFNVEGITVTDTTVGLHGVWDLGGTRRFQILRVPVEMFLDGTVLEALSAAAVARARHVDQEWEQFLLWG